MLKMRILMVLTVGAVFAAGFWLGKERTSRAAAKDRVFELRTYTASEGNLQALHARFRNHTTKLFQKHGMQNIGYWAPTDAPLSQNTLIYLLAYPDREAAKKAWTDFRNDPDWKKVQQESEVKGKLVTKVDSVYLEPTDYSAMK
jgi:NIPSNAP